MVVDLAKSYHFENNTTLIIKLKQNVKWHDGADFTSDDVIFTYNTIHDKNIFTPLVNDFKKVKTIKAIDKFTIKIIYKEPYFKALEIWMSGILPKHILKDEKDMKIKYEKRSREFREKLEKFDIELERKEAEIYRLKKILGKWKK